MAPIRPIPRNLLAAMAYAADILESMGVPYALMGGLNMILLGHDTRTTDDVDIMVEAPSFDNLISSLASDPVIRCRALPHTSRSGGPALVLEVDVNTDTPVKVDIIVAGQHKGTPPNTSRDYATTHTYTSPTDGTPRTVPALTLAAMFASKLAAVADDEFRMQHDHQDIPDLVWMCENRAEEVEAAADVMRGDEVRRKDMDVFAEMVGMEHWGIGYGRLMGIERVLGVNLG